MKIHSSCEIEDFVETHLSLQAVCDTPIARITSCVSSLRIYHISTPKILDPTKPFARVPGQQSTTPLFPLRTFFYFIPGISDT